MRYCLLHGPPRLINELKTNLPLKKIVSYPSFCEECGALLPPNGACTNNKCPNYSHLPPSQRRTVPPTVNSYADLGILGLYKYSISDPEERRRKRLLQLYVDELVHSNVNRPYVEELGPPRSDERVRRIVTILDGLNKFGWGDPRKRTADARYLEGVHENEKKDAKGPQ